MLQSIEGNNSCINVTIIDGASPDISPRGLQVPECARMSLEAVENDFCVVIGLQSQRDTPNMNGVLQRSGCIVRNRCG